jgi:hypothetical protein
LEELILLKNIHNNKKKLEIQYNFHQNINDIVYRDRKNISPEIHVETQKSLNIPKISLAKIWMHHIFSSQAMLQDYNDHNSMVPA